MLLLLPPDELFSLGGVEEEARSVFVLLLSQSLRLGRFCLQTLRISKKNFSKKIIYVKASFELGFLSVKKLSL